MWLSMCTHALMLWSFSDGSEGCHASDARKRRAANTLEWNAAPEDRTPARPRQDEEQVLEDARVAAALSVLEAGGRLPPDPRERGKPREPAAMLKARMDALAAIYEARHRKGGLRSARPALGACSHVPPSLGVCSDPTLCCPAKCASGRPCLERACVPRAVGRARPAAGRPALCAPARPLPSLASAALVGF